MSDLPTDPPPTATPWELQTWTSKRVCPTCSIPLFGARQDGFRIDACGKCGGAWLGHSMAEKMMHSRSAIPARLSETAAAAAREKQDVPLGRPCPDCQAPLAREVMRPCEVDTCKAHGTWFDAHELRAVAEAAIVPLQERDSAAANAGIMQIQADGMMRGAVVETAGVAFTAMRIGAKLGHRF
jgi:Zn-finger nucleic acid-binding protein